MAKTKKTTWEKSELEKIRMSLPDDYAEKLAPELGLNPETIKQVMRGNQPNDRVINRAIEYLQEYRQDIQLKKDFVASL